MVAVMCALRLRGRSVEVHGEFLALVLKICTVIFHHGERHLLMVVLVMKEYAERKIVMETCDVYILDRNTGRKALDICLDSCVYRKEGGGRGDLFCFQSGNMQVDYK